jgi:hypothetical protein
MPISASRAARAVRRLELTLDSLPDPRRRQGRIHPLDGLMRLILVAFACQRRVLRDVEDLCDDLGPGLRTRLGLRRPVSDTTLFSLLGRLDPTSLRPVLFEQVRRDLDSKAVRNDAFRCGVLAIDGKGAGSGLDSAPAEECRESVCDERGRACWDLYSVRACLVSSSTRVLLDQAFVDSKSGELTVFPAMLERLTQQFPKLFRILTADANFASRAAAELVLSHKRDYVFAIKENRARAFAVATGALATASVIASTVDRAQGKRVTRELRRAEVPADFDGFPGAREFWSVKQVRENPSGARECEERLFIVSLDAHSLSDEERLRLVRLHWQIENGPNWTLDMVLDEDEACPCKVGHGVAVVSWLRLLAYNLLSVFRAHLPQATRNRSWRRAADLIRQALIVLSMLAAEELRATLS